MYLDNNLFNPAWTSGNLSAISPIVTVIGYIAMCVISIGGFFMVILPITRNVINGIVVVAPNLCDKIDQAHKLKIGLGAGAPEGGNQVQMFIGTGVTILLSFIPNFKALSDFDEGVKDPKAYMLIAIPMMCVYIFIGVFIFYGYPAKVADKFAEAGTSFIDMALNNVDPAEWVEKIPTMLAKPDFGTKGATDQQSKNVYTASGALYRAVVSKHPEMTKDSRVTVSRAIESYISTAMSEITEYSDDINYKMTVDARVVTYEPQTNAKAEWPTPAVDEIENIAVFQKKDTIVDNFDLGVPGSVEGEWFLLNIKFTELPAEANTLTNVANNATVPYGQLSAGNGSVKWTLPESISVPRGNTNIKVNGIQGKYDEANGGVRTITFDGYSSIEDFISKGTGSCTNLLACESDKSKFHAIQKVEFSKGATTESFKPIDSVRFNGWEAGGAPTLKSNSKTDSSTETPVEDSKTN